MCAERIQLIDDRYLVQEQISSSGAVQWFYALDRQLERPVTVQMLSNAASHDNDIRTRFRNLQPVASAIHHPNVLEVYDAGEWEGGPFLVVERDAGVDASSMYKGAGVPPDLPAALRVTRQTADAVQYCRDAGLADWAFSVQAVRLGLDGSAQIALVEGIVPAPTGSARSASCRENDDLSILAGLLSLMLSGNTSPEQLIQEKGSGIPASVNSLLERMRSGHTDNFTRAGDVARAIAEIEASSSDYTQAYSPETSVAGTPVPPPGLDLERTASLADAPTLAVSALSAAPGHQAVPVPYLPASDALAELPVPASGQTGDQVAPPMPYRAPAVAARESPSRKMPAWTIPLAVATLLLVLLALAWSRQAGSTTGASATPQAHAATSPTTVALISVPDLRGKNVDEARAAAESAGLSVTLGEPVESADVERDLISSQEPPPGTEAARGSIVLVSLSLGTLGQEAEQPQTQPATPPGQKKDNNKGKPGKHK